MVASMPRRKTSAQIRRAAELFSALRKTYPAACCALHWKQPHELLIATMLSAQATDVSVNKATPALFKAFPTVAAFAESSVEDIAPFLRTLNFWRTKARAVYESLRTLHTRFHGTVPNCMEDLLSLRGVARKTANVVLGNAFNIQEGVVVDTHVARLSKRMGLTRHTDPIHVEQDLMGLFPQEHWCELSHLLIEHGRRVCKARGNTCSQDPVCRKFCRESKTVTRSKASPSKTRRPPVRQRPCRRNG